MIRTINIKNFKSLKDINLQLGQYNLFCGTNASGKSSIIQAILLMAQNYLNEKEVLLNGDIVSLGEYIEVKNFDTGMDVPIEISFEDQNRKKSNITFSQDTIIKNQKDFPLENQVNMFYLSANRIGNSDVFEKSPKANIFGNLGEYAISFLNKEKDTIMPTQFIYDTTENTAHNFFDEVNYWMKKITGSQINIDDIVRTNKLVLSYKTSGNKLVRNSNTGSGLSFVISIIILGLGIGLLYNDSPEKPIVIIENPEIHLHPKAQAVLSDFLAWLSDYMQVIIETHSDHIFNGYRRSIKDGRLNVESSNVFFFELNGNTTEIKKINFSKNGKMLTLEKNLFDQFQLDLSQLLG